jgi:hypothetical protein
MRRWWCPNTTFDLAAGGTGCAEGSHNPNSVYPSEAVKAQAKLDYPNARPTKLHFQLVIMVVRYCMYTVREGSHLLGTHGE